MGLINKIAQYKELKSGVKHCTFNPDGPGVVRIHLIPPKFNFFKSSSYVVILNGYYLLPLGYSWAIMLSKFINEVNKFDGKPITDQDYKNIFDITVEKSYKVYPSINKEDMKDDLSFMLDTIFKVAKGQNIDTEIEKMSIRQYGKNMIAPHRMDLMISAMNDENGKWQCNQKCIFCYASGQCLSKTKELSTQEWKKAIDKLKKAGVPMVTFTGGEPTLRQDLCELIDYSKWFVTRLNTNGVLLTPSLCEILAKASLDSVQITLYSSDENIHNALVGSERFCDTVNGIKNAVNSGLDVSINTPLCKKNSDYISTLKFVKDLGVKFVTVSGLICTGTAEINHSEYDLSSNELYETVKSAKEFCNANGMEIDFTSPGLIKKELLEELNMNVPMCGACLSNMAIAPDGTVIPCQSWLKEGSGLGNILTENFNKIWNNKKCYGLRNMNDTEALNCPFRKENRGECE
ncbi:MAG: radical SAM protein [Clostridia bacterium]|nr:radical SAM protein [Clostridia bacterium]